METSRPEGQLSEAEAESVGSIRSEPWHSIGTSTGSTDENHDLRDAAAHVKIISLLQD
jgi:hypothetical protein